MSDGRAATPATPPDGRPGYRRPAPWPRRPADLYVFGSGVASVVFGLVMTVYAVVARPGVGSFGLVPEVMAGFALVLLGTIAIVLSRPPGATDLNRGVAWLSLVAGIAATASVVIVAVDDVAGPLPSDRGFAQVVVVIGRSVIIAGMVALAVAVVLGGLRLIWYRFFGPWATRWFR